MATFVRAKGERRLDPRQPVLTPVKNRLLDHFHTEFGQSARFRSDVEIVPAFIGIDDQPRAWRPGTNRCNPVPVPLTRQLAFQQGKASARRSTGVGFHLVRVIQADGESSGQRCRRLNARQLPNGNARLSGLQVPQRAVKRVARRASRHRYQQRLAIQRPLIGVDGGGTAFGCFTFVINRRAFAPAHMYAIAHGTDHDVHRGFGAPADNEGARYRPAFDGGGNYTCHRRFLIGNLRSGHRLYAKIAGRRIVPPDLI